MEEAITREFLTSTGLKAKEIGDRLSVNDRTVQRWIKGSPIPEYMCKLVQLEFTEYDISSGNKVEEPKENYNGASQIISNQKKENERLNERIAELEKIGGLQSRNIELLEEQILIYKGRLEKYEGKKIS